MSHFGFRKNVSLKSFIKVAYISDILQFNFKKNH